MLKAYLGKSPCGCTTAAMVDDETMTAQDVADFAREMAKSGRRVEHLVYDPAERKVMLDICTHGKRRLERASTATVAPSGSHPCSRPGCSLPKRTLKWELHGCEDPMRCEVCTGLDTTPTRKLYEKLYEARTAKKRHRESSQCERPSGGACTACHFWSGAIAALTELLGMPGQID